jgi:flagellar protein FlaG
MISSNITSSTAKLPEPAVPVKAGDGRVVVSRQAPEVEAKPAVTPIEPPAPKAEQRKAPEPSAASTEEMDQAMREKVKEAVENVRDFIKKNQRTLDFEMAEESNRVIITVIDRETNKVIRQIPPEDVVNISEQIQSGELPSPDGMLFNVKA